MPLSHARATAYLAGDLDLNGPLSVVTRFRIMKRYPLHEPPPGHGRLWVVLMERSAGSFTKAAHQIREDLASGFIEECIASRIKGLLVRDALGEIVFETDVIDGMEHALTPSTAMLRERES